MVEVAVPRKGVWASCNWFELIVKLGNSSADAVTDLGKFDGWRAPAKRCGGSVRSHG